ncbi:PLxRFG domain-containing protein [Celeribacter sp.]|uniref:PLxRFG domain-containing protein n=1 Tax=Celeribacter sp. TaxID=1890673 RepID=UPI003A95CDA2
MTPEEEANQFRNAEMGQGHQIATQKLKELEDAGFQMTNWSDIDGLSSAIGYVGENIAMSLPQMMTAIGSGGFSPITQTIIMGGEANAELAEKTDIPAEDRARIAATAGLGMWALENIGLGTIFGKALPSDVAIDAIGGKLAGKLAEQGFPKAAARMMQAAIVEGSTEALQEAVIMGATASAGGEYEVGEVVQRLTDSFVAGGAVGGAFRGAHEVATGAGKIVGDKIEEGAQRTQQSDPYIPPLEPASDQVAEMPEATGLPDGVVLDGAESSDIPAVNEEIAPEISNEMTAQPTGPVSSVAAMTPDLTPAPEVESIVRFPDMKAGKEIKIQAPDGLNYDAVFLGEQDGGVQVRIGGDVIDLSPHEFDAAIAAARAVEDLAPDPQSDQVMPKAEDVAPASNDIPATDPSAAETPDASTAPRKLSDMAIAEIAPPRAKDDVMDVETARRAVGMIEDVAKRSGWDANLERRHREAQEIVSAADLAKIGTPQTTGQDEWASTMAEGKRVLSGAELDYRPENENGETSIGVGPYKNGKFQTSAVIAKDDNGKHFVKWLTDSYGKGTLIRAGKKEASDEDIDALLGQIEVQMAADDVKVRVPPTINDEEAAIVEASPVQSKKASKDKETEPSSPNEVDEKEIERRQKEEERAEIEARSRNERPALWSLIDDKKVSRFDGGTDIGVERGVSGQIKDQNYDGPSRLLGSPMIFHVDERGQEAIYFKDPSFADHPLVAEVEEKTGLKASLKPDDIKGFSMGEDAYWHHAVDLVRAHDIDGLIASKHLLSPEVVARAISFGLASKEKTPLKIPEARRALKAYGITKPDVSETEAFIKERGAADASSLYFAPDRIEGVEDAARQIVWANLFMIEKGWWPFKGSHRKLTQEGRDFVSEKPASNEVAASEAQSSPAEPSSTEVAAVASEADPNPTEAQKEAGNYRMGHMQWRGMDLTIENAKGSERSGIDQDGEAWSVTMPAHYGYFKGTEGADGDHVDFYMGENPDSDAAFVVDQYDATSAKFDEHKVMIGFKSKGEATKVYDAGFSDGKGPDRRGAVTEMDAAALQSWLSRGKKSGPLGQPKEAPAAPKNSKEDIGKKPTDKIEDFGEKIGGARKDIWSSYADKISEAGNLDTETVPLSKSWPAPDYLKLIENGVERWKVDFIRVARDSIPTKPSRKHRVRGWATRVELLREFTEKVLDGTYKRTDIDRVLGQPETDRDMSALRGAMELYEAVGHEKSLKGMKFRAANYSVYQGQAYNPPKVFWEVTQSSKASAFSNMPNVIARGDSKKEALEAFGKAYATLDTTQKKADKKRKFLIYAHNGSSYFTVGTKIGSTYVELRRTDTVEEARRIRADEADQLTEQLDKMRQIPADRRPDNMPRMGVDHRSGADITPEQFGDAFGFRGVEFGNWVEGGRRQQDLNDAYDALMDMAGLLDLPPRAISLNGSLGLAFGARGVGGVSPAAAHYEPGNVVINLTKKQGAGSLAHEWFHAIDNYFGKMREGRAPSSYITDNAAPGHRVDGVRDEVVDAFVALRHAIGKTDLKKRSSNIDKMRSKAYWGTGIEMHARAFESYVIAKLADQNIANDYLANIVNGAAWGLQAELSGLGDSYPYLKSNEIEVVRPAFDQLFETISTRESERGVELYQKGGSEFSRPSSPVSKAGEMNGVPSSEIRDVSDVVSKIVDAHGLGGKVSVKAMKQVLTASGIPVLGAYRGGEVKVTATAADPAHVASHEIIHALRDQSQWNKPYGLFTKAEWQALVRAARADKDIRHAVNAAYSELGATAQSEEMVAEFYADWVRSRDVRPSGALGKALDRMKSFFRAIASALRGSGFIDAAQVMRGIANGDIGRRASDSQSNDDGVRGEERTMLNTGTKEFREWFGDSKVVEESGAPLVVYHGTDAEFEAFDIETAGQTDEGFAGRGFYFTDAEDIAQEYGASAPYFLSIQKPLRVANYREIHEATGVPYGRDKSGAKADEIRRKLKEMGHDGVIVRDTDGERVAHEFVAFDPSQIKSIYNRGTFDPDDDRTMYQKDLSDRLTQSKGAARDDSAEFAADFMAQLADNDEVFSYPKSAATSVRGVFADVRANIEYVGDTARSDEADESGADRRYLLRTEDGTDFYVYETDDNVWIDVSELSVGQGGSVIYAAVGDYAANTDRKFIGDPAGLSDDALIRRTDAMLSSALKHGTTDHLAPHQRQLEGDPERGIPALQWTDGDHLGNISSLIKVSAMTYTHLFPDLADARYDFESGEYRSAEGTRMFSDDGGATGEQVVQRGVSSARDGGAERFGEGESASDAAHRDGNGSERGGETRAGRRTLKRTTLLNTLLRAESGERSALLARVLRRSGQLLENDRLGGTLYQKDLRNLKDQLTLSKGKDLGMLGRKNWKGGKDFFPNLLTDSMAGAGKFNVLSLVPGRALFSELGKHLVNAQAYLNFKESMDTLRNDWHARADETAQKWSKLRGKDAASNEAFMALMHDTTIAGIDPSKPDDWTHALAKSAKDAISRYGDKAPEWASDVMRQIEEHKASYASFQRKFNALPKEFQTMYRMVLKDYNALGSQFEKAVLDNMKKATEIAIRRAERQHVKEIQKISDEGLEGAEKEAAIASADKRLAEVKSRGGWGARARIAALRKSFESNRLQGPYFPLARFGKYFVTVRDEKGKVISFSRFDKVRDQKRAASDFERDGASKVELGVIESSDDLKSQVDPTFVADVELLLADTGASGDVMDSIWQMWLETLPDHSIRKSNIHRKNRAGFSQDALRAYSHHMFHGAHQLARLQYGLEMQDALDEAAVEARKAKDPVRSGLIVDEMRLRHKFTMNPEGSSAVAAASSLAFVWYLGATPAAALANITQTTVVGIPILTARFKTATATRVTRELTRATKDFAKGKGEAGNSSSLTADEKNALEEAYKRGVVDKTQAHDLASVADSGIEYSPVREKWMKRIGWMFHHAERLNREVTFLAAYRLAKRDGMDAETAIKQAAEATWATHFDYQNTSRPRIMQSDMGKILTVFRQFTVNMLWRLFRDSHQALKGATKEERAEARTQLIGITLSMMAHAGVRGVWGYGLMTALIAMFPGGAEDGDDVDEWLQDALLMEGDDLGTAAWNYAMGAVLNGAPGQVFGIDLRERIGMPNLWFRPPSRDLEGSDLYAYYVAEVLGPVAGIGEGWVRGVSLIASGEVQRGFEAGAPKMLRDLSKSERYLVEGVTTYSGDSLIEDVNPWQVLMQAAGFTPAAISERYEINNRLKNDEQAIIGRRKTLHRRAGDALISGEPIPESVLESIREFNREYPEYPITSSTLKRSVQGRQRASAKNEFGVQLNDKLNDRLRADEPPRIYS